MRTTLFTKAFIILVIGISGQIINEYAYFMGTGATIR